MSIHGDVHIREGRRPQNHTAGTRLRRLEPKMFSRSLFVCALFAFSRLRWCYAEEQLVFKDNTEVWQSLNETTMCPSPQVNVRLPSSMTADFDTNATWQGPPSGWLYGNWKIAWSSNPLYQPFWNPEFENSPSFPQPQNGSLINDDLETWNTQCEDDTEIYSIFLHDTEE